MVYIFDYEQVYRKKQRGGKMLLLELKIAGKLGLYHWKPLPVAVGGFDDQKEGKDYSEQISYWWSRRIR